MDRTKLSIIVSVVMIIMLVTYIYINLETQELLKEVRTTLNQTDYNCCDIYRSPMMPSMCYNLRSGVLPFSIPTSLPSSPSFQIDQSDLDTT